jgi:AsmA protein
MVMKAWKIVAIIVAVLIVVVIALPFVIDVNAFRPRIESELTTALGRQVKIGNLKFSILSGGISADNLSIADDPSLSNAPFIQAKGLKVGVDLAPLIFSKTLHVTELVLEQPQVTLLRTTSGKWNFSSLGSHSASTSSTGEASPTPATSPASPSAPAPSGSSGSSFTNNLAVGKLSIQDGQVSIGDTAAPGKIHVYQKVNVTVKNFSFNSQFPFSLSAVLPGNGTLNLDGNAGPVNPNDAASTPLQAQLKIKQLDLSKSGLIDSASGIAGLADFDGTLSSDGKTAQSNGTANMAKLQLVPKSSPATRPVSLKYALNYDQQQQSGTLQQGDVTVGQAIAKLTGTFQTKGSDTTLNMALNAQAMPVNDLESMLPALGVVLPSGSSLQGGTLSTTLAIRGPLANLVVTGPVRLADTKLAGFNLGSKMSAISALSGMKTGTDTSIQNFSADLHYAPSGIQTQNVNLTVPAVGVMTGAGDINPAGALNYKMTASLSGTAVAGLTQMAGLGAKSGSIPFFIHGTTSDPKFEPDVKGMVTGALGGLKGNSGTNSVVNTLGGLFQKKKQK